VFHIIHAKICAIPMFITYQRCFPSPVSFSLSLSGFPLPFTAQRSVHADYRQTTFHITTPYCRSILSHKATTKRTSSCPYGWVSTFRRYIGRLRGCVAENGLESVIRGRRTIFSRSTLGGWLQFFVGAASQSLHFPPRSVGIVYWSQ